MSIAGVGYACAGISFSSLHDAIENYTLLPVFALLLVSACDYAFMALRLRLLFGVAVTFRQSLIAVILCVGFNSILPAKAGDAFKACWLGRTMQKSLLEIVPLIIWERMFDLLTLAVVICGLIMAAGLEGVSWGLAAAWLALVIIYCVLRHFSHALRMFYASRLPKKLRTPARLLHETLIDKPTARWIGQGCASTATIWLCSYAGFFLALNHIGGFGLSATQVCFVFAVTSASSALPSAPGSLGIFEGSMVWALSRQGISQDAALGLAVLLHLVYFLLPVGCALTVQAGLGGKDAWPWK